MSTLDGLVTGTNKIVRAGCNRGESWRLQNTFVCFGFESHYEEQLCCDLEEGGVVALEGLLSQRLKAKLAHPVLNTPPCPYSTD